MNGHDQDFNADPPGHEPPDDDLHAGEYVLGVLDAIQRQRAQVRIDAEPGFARSVQAWEHHFGALLAQIEPVAVPAHVWLRVRSRLGWAPVAGARRGLWQNVNFWRGAAVAALASAAVIAVLALMRPVPPAPTPAPVRVVVTPPVPAPTPAAEPSPVITLAQDDGSAAWLATIDRQLGRVRITPVPAPADSAGRVPELWLIAPGQAPRSLGVVDTRTAHQIQVPADLRDALQAGSVLAITLEPPGGAPQGVPTGPIVAKGKITAS